MSVNSILKRYRELENMARQSFLGAPEPSATKDGISIFTQNFRSYDENDLQERIRTLAIIRDVEESKA